MSEATTTVLVPPEAPKVIEEGQARILCPKDNEVFYNEVQCFNRDVSVLMLRLFSETRHQEFKAASQKRSKRTGVADEGEARGLRALEALSATGLRSIRYWKEASEGLESILVNDLDPDAVAAIRRNVEFNELDCSKVIPNLGDAKAVMYNAIDPTQRRFDFVDLDPYGSAMPFLDAAVQSVEDGGMLAITCTDKANLCGPNPEVCWYKYGTSSLRGPHCHEMALRVLLHSIQSACGRYGRYIEPVLSLSLDFYVRVFVRVFTSSKVSKLAAVKEGYIFQCVQCSTLHSQPVGVIKRGQRGGDNFATARLTVSEKCQFCGGAQSMGGPFWLAPLHNLEWLDRALAIVKEDPTKFHTAPRMTGILTVCREELPVPLFYSLARLCANIRSAPIKATLFRAALLNAGYRVSDAHTYPSAVKTDAPPAVIWTIFRKHLESQPTPKRMPDFGKRLMAVEPACEVDFTVCPGAKPDRSFAKYMPNPKENWGPKARASKRPREEGNKQKRRRKKKLCWLWAKEGKCMYGDACKFAHKTFPEDEAAQTPPEEAMKTPEDEAVPCTEKKEEEKEVQDSV